MTCWWTYGTLDDLTGQARRAMAATVVRLARPGSAFLLWCFYGDESVLPRVSFTGPSRLAPGLAHEEERELFARDFDIEVIGKPKQGDHGFGCFLMTLR